MDIIQSLGYAHDHNGQRYIAVPMGSDEPKIADVKKNSMCPVAHARGVGSSPCLLEAITKILARECDAIGCPQCDGVWFYADSQLHHISGDALAKADQARQPQRNQQILCAIFPPWKLNSLS